eukprot:5262191-Pleurochrysis_carterae.AAC.1
MAAVTATCRLASSGCPRALPRRNGSLPWRPVLADTSTYDAHLKCVITATNKKSDTSTKGNDLVLGLGTRAANRWRRAWPRPFVLRPP